MKKKLKYISPLAVIAVMLFASSQLVAQDGEAIAKYLENAYLKYESKSYGPNEAIKTLTECISKYDSQDCLYHRGLFYSMMKRDSDAVNDFTSLINKPQTNGYGEYFASSYFKLLISDFYLERGKSYGNLKKFDLAIADFTKAISVEEKGKKAGYIQGESKNLHSALIFRAFCYALKGDSNMALSDMKKTGYYDDRELAYHIFYLILQDSPKNIEVLELRADLLYYEAANFSDMDAAFKQGIADYTTLITLNPSKQSNYLSARASLYVRMSEYQSAIADYTKVIALKPDNMQTFYERSQVYIKTEQYELAIADLTKYAAFKPDQSLYEQLGEICHTAKKYDLAIANYTKAISIDNDLERYFYKRGLVYYDTKQNDLAIADFRKTLELNEDHEEAKEMLVKLGITP